ncbi:hypothetical protein DW167_13740 [Bacteroides thetaiotaomicron]|nr:hypothetical protein DW167_13740 [Bacteroides thetaiotaomicron]
MIFQYCLPLRGRHKGFPITYRVTGKANIVYMLQSILCKVIESGKQIKKRRFAQEMKGIKHGM